MNTASFQRIVEESGAKYRAWGLSGSEIANRLSARLGTELASELREFVENFGNLSVDPFIVAITGNEKGEFSAESSTDQLHNGEVGFPAGSLRIMEHAGESYFVDLASGEVAAFDTLNITPTARTLKFDSFDEFLKWVVKESAEQLHDSRFQF